MEGVETVWGSGLEEAVEVQAPPRPCPSPLHDLGEQKQGAGPNHRSAHRGVF